MHELTVIFLGPQGSGKGTQADLLAEKLKTTGEVVYFEAGERLRMLAKDETYTGRLTREAMSRGELLPVFLSTRAFSEHMVQEMREGVHLLVDGFPRAANQLEIFGSALEFYKRREPIAFYLSISDEEAVERLMARKRADDTEDGIRRRLQWSRKEEQSVMDWFRQSPCRFIEIKGERSIEEIHEDIVAAIGLS